MPTAPAASTTSPSARAAKASPPCIQATPTARPFSTTTRLTWAPVTSFRFGRVSTGFRNPRAALQRRPAFWLTWK